MNRTIIDLGQRQVGLRSLIFNRLTPTRGLTDLSQTLAKRARRTEISLTVRPGQLILAGQTLDDSKVEAHLLHRAGIRQVAIKAGTNADVIKKGLAVLTDRNLSGIERKLPKQFGLDPERPFTETIIGHYNRLTNIPKAKSIIALGYAVSVIFGISPLAIIPIALFGVPPFLLALTGPFIHLMYAKVITPRRAAAAEKKVAEMSWEGDNRKELAHHLAYLLLDQGPASLTEETITRTFPQQKEDAKAILAATKTALQEMDNHLGGRRQKKAPSPANSQTG